MESLISVLILYILVNCIIMAIARKQVVKFLKEYENQVPAHLIIFLLCITAIFVIKIRIYRK